MKASETVKRYILFIISLFFIALGVAYTKTAELGVSPISSVANILSLKFTFLSIGGWLTFTNCLMIIGQIILYGKSFKPIQLLQLPLSFLFGIFTDIGMKIAALIPITSYFVRISYVFAGVIILAFGISLSVIADVIMNSGEAFVKAIADKLKKGFGDVKVIFDVSYVGLSVLLSIILFGSVEGTREGTVIAAFGTGFVVKLFKKLLTRPLESFLSKGGKSK